MSKCKNPVSLTSSIQKEKPQPPGTLSEFSFLGGGTNEWFSVNIEFKKNIKCVLNLCLNVNNI